MSLASGTGAALVLSTGVADSVTSEVPLDPVLTLGLVTLGFIALGWLVGPSLGNALFYLVKSKYKAPMTVVSSSHILVGSVVKSKNSVLTMGFFYRRRASSLRGSKRIALILPMTRQATQVCITFCPSAHTFRVADSYYSSRLLRRKNLKRCWLSTMAEGPAGIQQEAHHFHIISECGVHPLGSMAEGCRDQGELGETGLATMP